MKTCKKCGREVVRPPSVYCSNICQQDFQFDVYIQNWKCGKEDGGRGVVARNISRHLKRYLLLKYNERCCQCGWNKKHPSTGAVPLEIDHINGNAEDNSEKNLRLLCPNCHALTITFRNLNKGNGRGWRKTTSKRNS